MSHACTHDNLHFLSPRPEVPTVNNTARGMCYVQREEILAFRRVMQIHSNKDSDISVVLPAFPLSVLSFPPYFSLSPPLPHILLIICTFDPIIIFALLLRNIPLCL